MDEPKVEETKIEEPKIDIDKISEEKFNLGYGKANASFHKKLLKEVDLFDVYEGDKLPEGKKSYAVSFVLQDEQKTLNDKLIEKVMQKIQDSLEKNLNAVLR